MTFVRHHARRLLVGAYLFVTIIATWQRGVASREHTTFAIFRQSFVHLTAHRDLYALYPAEHGAASQDLFKYSPSAAVLFAPLSFGPYALALLGWNLLNAGLLFWAVARTLPRRRANLALMLILPEVFTTIQASSSNALVAALMLLGIGWILEDRRARAATAIGIGVAIKLFPIAAAALALTRPRRGRFIALLATVGVVLFAMPLLVVSARELVDLYQSWRVVERADAADIQFGMSLIRALREFWETLIPNWAFQLAGGVIVMLPFLRRTQWDRPAFQRRMACSLLVFVVLFNHQAERQSLIIAAVGCAIWLVSRPFSLPLAIMYAIGLTGASILPFAALWLALQADLLAGAPTELAERIAGWVSRRLPHVAPCPSCRVLVPNAAIICPDCGAWSWRAALAGPSQVFVRMSAVAVVLDLLTPGHYILPWNLWDLVQ